MAWSMSAIPGPSSWTINSMPTLPDPFSMRHRTTPEPAYRKAFRTNSEAAVMIRVTSVIPKPNLVAASRTDLRTTTMSVSVRIGTSSGGEPFMALALVGPILQDVKRPIYTQGGPRLAQRQSELGDGDGDTRPHPGQDCASTHQADHLRRLSNRSAEKRIQRFDGRDIQDNAPRWRPLHRQQHFLLERRDGCVIRVGWHRDHEDVANFDDRKTFLGHCAPSYRLPSALTTCKFSRLSATRKP